MTLIYTFFLNILSIVLESLYRRFQMETRHFFKNLRKGNVKTFFSSTFIALNVKCVPRFSNLVFELVKLNV